MVAPWISPAWLAPAAPELARLPFEGENARFSQLGLNIALHRSKCLEVAPGLQPQELETETVDRFARASESTFVVSKEPQRVEKICIVVFIVRVRGKREHLVRRGRDQDDARAMLAIGVVEECPGEHAGIVLAREQMLEALEFVQDDDVGPMEDGLRDADTLYVLKLAYDEGFSRLAPGNFGDGQELGPIQGQGIRHEGHVPRALQRVNPQEGLAAEKRTDNHVWPQGRQQLHRRSGRRARHHHSARFAKPGRKALGEFVAHGKNDASATPACRASEMPCHHCRDARDTAITAGVESQQVHEKGVHRQAVQAYRLILTCRSPAAEARVPALAPQ